MERAVVGWDGSTAAEAALDWALRHEPGCGSIELVVIDEDGADRRSAAAVASAEAAAERIRATRPGCAVTVTVEHGSPVAVLAGRTAPDVLLVLGGADPRSGRHRSSTAYRVAAEASGPVAMVPEGFDHGRDVVLGVGDDPPPAAAVLAAAEQAAQRGQRLVAVHAWRRFFDFGTVSPVDPRYEREVAKEYEPLLDATLEPVAARYPSLPVARRVMHGRPIDAVIEAARTAALLVIGRDGEHAPGPLGRSVTQVAMLTSPVPVLLVPRQPADAAVSSPARWGGSASR
jgi:hypothetical protein